MKRINIKGAIIPSDYQWIYDLFGMEATSPKKVEEQIAAANGEDLEVIINSGGGSVFAGSEIYTSLKDYPGNVTVKIVGFAGSAASVVAMGGKTKILMSPTAQFMMHNASLGARGNYRDMEHAAEILRSTDETVINAYRLKSGLDREKLLDMMDNETWLTPQRALEHNLIDEIMFDDEFKLVASANDTQMIPEQVINKLKNELLKSGLQNITNLQEPLNKKEESTLNLEEIKNQHPELYAQIKKEGHEEGLQAGIEQERTRIQAIDDLAMPGNEAIINKAKFETCISAEQVAMEIIKDEKQRGTNFLNDRRVDAQNLNDVDGTAAPLNADEKAAKIEAAAQGIAAAADKRRGK